MEATRHLERGSERLGNSLQQFELLLVGLVAIKSRPDRGSEVQDGTRHLQLGLFKLGCCHALAQREVENVQKIRRGAQFQFRRAASDQEADSAIESRVF